MRIKKIPRIRRWLPAACLFAMLSPFPAVAFTLEGPARAVNAHTIVIHGTHVVLLGIQPIGADDKCGPDAAPWTCGDRAQTVLQRLVGTGATTCDLTAKIGHGDFQGACTIAGNRDLAGALVEAGWAHAADERYEAAEAAARKAMHGAWGQHPPTNE